MRYLASWAQHMGHCNGIFKYLYPFLPLSVAEWMTGVVLWQGRLCAQWIPATVTCPCRQLTIIFLLDKMSIVVPLLSSCLNWKTSDLLLVILLVCRSAA